MNINGIPKSITHDNLESTVINVLSKVQMYMRQQMSLKHVTELVNRREIQRKLLFDLLKGTLEICLS